MPITVIALYYGDIPGINYKRKKGDPPIKIINYIDRLPTNAEFVKSVILRGSNGFYTCSLSFAGDNAVKWLSN